MAIENEQQETTSNEENSQTPKTMLTDLGGGIKAELPIEDAKAYIAWKNTRTASYKELETNHQSLVNSHKELAEKSKLLESIKESGYDDVKKEIEGRIKDDYETQLGSLKQKLIGTAVDAAIASEPSIVTDPAARADLKQLFIGTHQDLSDDSNDIVTKLQEFVKAKPHFIRANKDDTKIPVTKSKVTPPVPTETTSAYLRGILGV